MWFRHSNAGAEALGAVPEEAEALIGCVVDKAAERAAASPTSLRHQLSTTCHCRHNNTANTRYTTAVMSDNGNDEGGDPSEMVTKPFKFVTGEPFPHLREY